MSKRLLASTVFAILVSACGGGDSAATTVTPPAGDSTTTTTAAAATTTAAVTTTQAATTTTTGEPELTFAALGERQQELVDRICKAAADPGQRATLVGETTIMSVMVGEVGVPALEQAWTELGQDPAAEVWNARLEAAAPICDALAWSPVVTTTTTVVAALAAITIEIGDFTIDAETEGCPPAEILAGEYWIGPNRDKWTDAAGEDWTVSLSVDASDGDLKWSFSLDGSQRWVSYHVNQSVFESELSAETGIFETIFNDQIASVSGGKPDTPGSVTIICS